MSEAMAYDRLLPCLLDRLTDEEPEAATESRDRRVISFRRYLDGVRRDLSWLLNSREQLAGEPIHQYPEAARSVLNLGIADLCGVTASSIQAGELERNLRQAILTYEPRIVRSSLSVRVIRRNTDGDTQGKGREAGGHNALVFEISGELWAQPAPEAFFVKTQVDLETGEWRL